MNFKPLLTIVLFFSLAANLYLAHCFFNPVRKIDSQLAPIDRIEVIRSKGGLLQVSTIKAPEIFESTKPNSILGIDLGATTTQIRVPATYNYYIELAPEWKVTVRGKTFIVVAPAVKPSLPVAIDTSHLERFSSGVWSFLTGPAELNALQKTITPILAKKAATPSYIKLQREYARKTVQEFVAKWVIDQKRWKKPSDYAIVVYFADEPISSLAATPLPYLAAKAL